MLLLQAAMAGLASRSAVAVDYSTLLGAANIDAAYYLNGSKDVLNDAQSQLVALGSHTEKLELDQYNLNNTWSAGTSKYAWNSNWPAMNSSTTLVTIAQLPPMAKAFADPNITSYDLTTYSPNIPNGGDGTGYWNKGISTAQQQAETTSFYNLTKYLMQTYSGTGKTFYLSNWEGDGALVDALPSGATVPPTSEVQGMIAWLNARQLGITEARNQFASQYPNVHVYGTVEVNHVQAAMQGDVYNGVSNFATVTNDVLPNTTTDFVSYSSYDTQKNTTGAYSYANAVAYVAAHLPATAINGQNTHSEYVGEFGTAENYSGPATLNSLMNNVINTAVTDGMPLAFYWEVYSNELTSGVNTPPGGSGNVSAVQGFYMVKPDGTPSYAWQTYRYLIQTHDPNQATSAAVERNLHLGYASNFTAPGATLSSAWTINNSSNAMPVIIANSQLQMTTADATNTPIGQATLNIDSVLGHGLAVGDYLQFTLNRKNDTGIIGVSAFGLNHGSAIGSGSGALQVYPNSTYGWTPISYNGSNNTNFTYNFDTPGTTLGLRLTSADGAFATVAYYVNGTYSGSWLYQTSSSTLDSFSLFAQSSTTNAGFGFNNLAIYTSNGSAGSINYRWDPARNGSASGGSGGWDAGTTANFYNGSSDLVWNNATLADQVSFGGTAGTVTVSSAGVTASTIVVTSPNYILAGGPITMLGNQTINASNGNVAINSVINGSNGLTIIGTGNVTLGASNTYTNGLYISAGGTANFTTDANLGAAGNGINLSNGTLNYTGTTAPTLTRTITVGSGGGTLSLANSAGTGKLVINGTNVITGAGTLTKTGPGWLTLYGSNNFTGNWNINGGVVEAGGTGVLGTGTVTVNSTAELSSNNQIPVTNAITVNTGATLSADSNTTGTGSFTGPITAAGNFTVRLGNFWSGTNQNVTISGNLAGSGSLTVGNAYGASSTTGVLTLSGNNSAYSGNIIIPNGVVTPAVSSNVVLGTGTVTLSGGKLALTGQVTVSGTPSPITSISATGYNIDTIYAGGEGSKYPSGNGTTNTLMDGTFSFFQNGFTPPTGSLNAGTALTGGLTGTSITSTTTNPLISGHSPFTLQSLTAANVLQITEGSTGTLALNTPTAYANLAILANSSWGGDASPQVTIHFSDGTTVNTTYNAYDWSLGSDSMRQNADVFGTTGINRYSPTQSPGWDKAAYGIYETDIDLTNIGGVSYANRQITSLTFTADTTDTQGRGKTDIFAMSGSAALFAAGGPYQSYNNNVSVTANSNIDVSGSLNAYLGTLNISTATLTVSSADTTGAAYSLNFQSTTQGGSPTFNILNSSGGGKGTVNLYDGQAGYPSGITIGNVSSGMPHVYQSFTVTSGTVAFPAHAAGQSTAVTVVSSLNLSGSGSIDLTNNALIIRNGTVGTINGYVQSSLSGGAWSGIGITSSSAADDPAHLTALGVLLNGANYSNFEGQSVGPGDVLVKYTYYGDSDLSGTVDSSDYTRIDNGYLNHLTGWQNGDFNYDSTVNGSDYTLIDNAFNSQGANIAAQITLQNATSSNDPTSVPEPSLGGFSAGLGIALLRRRSRGLRSRSGSGSNRAHG